jgi:hypothetical protein
MGCMVGFNAVKKGKFLPLPGIEARFSGCPVLSLVSKLRYPSPIQIVNIRIELSKKEISEGLRLLDCKSVEKCKFVRFVVSTVVL